ncbi:hypothetical protein NVP1149O_65 [Vibrio phage 1.149.O._10N.286.55.A12]|nr:hypothetical protein NVP1149O_65 [Vibrio phage 1.149.O._10N.286.55.A12]
MKTAKMPSKEYLQECLDYNSDTGIFTWKTRPVNHFVSSHGYKVWNAKYAGKMAGSEWVSFKGKKYLRISINKKHYKAHRLAFAIMGVNIDGIEIDHDDGNGLNNKWLNISKSDRNANMQNTRKRSDNTSGCTGVSWHNPNKTWKARIYVNGKEKCIGYFKNKDDAVKARLEASCRYGYNKNHGVDRPL